MTFRDPVWCHRLTTHSLRSPALKQWFSTRDPWAPKGPWSISRGLQQGCRATTQISGSRHPNFLAPTSKFWIRVQNDLFHWKLKGMVSTTCLPHKLELWNWNLNYRLRLYFCSTIWMCFWLQPQPFTISCFWLWLHSPGLWKPCNLKQHMLYLFCLVWCVLWKINTMHTTQYCTNC